MADDHAREAIPAREPEALGYVFRAPTLLEQALTHPSVAAENPSGGGHHNQRLEFLGDAVVGLVVSAWLYRRFSDLPEGELTRLRSEWVQGPSLARLARKHGLAGRVRLGKGARAQGIGDQDRVLAAAFEAVLGAIFLDGGWDAAVRSLEACLEADAPEPTTPAQSNPKGALQEHLARAGAPPPEYRLLEVTGPPHRRRFTVELTCQGAGKVVADGTSRQGAEQEAARRALDRLGVPAVQGSNPAPANPEGRADGRSARAEEIPGAG